MLFSLCRCQLIHINHTSINIATSIIGLHDALPIYSVQRKAADLSSQSSYDSVKYKRAWHRAKGIRSSILSSGENPYAQSRALYIVLNHREIASIMAVTGTIFPKQYANAITRHEQKKKYCPMQHLLEINKNKQKTEKRLSYPILCPLCHLYQIKHIKMKLMQFRIYFNVTGQVHVVNKKKLLQNVDI